MKIRFGHIFFLLNIIICYGGILNCIDSNPIILQDQDQQQPRNLKQFVCDSIDNGISIEQIIIQAQKLGYNEALIKTTLKEILEQIEHNNKEASKKSNKSWYIIGGMGCCVVVAAIVYIMMRNYQKNEAIYRSDETRPLNIQMQINDIDGLLIENERQQRNNQIAMEIERQIQANRPCREIIEDIRRNNPAVSFSVRTEGRGSLAGSYLAYDGMRLYEGQTFFPHSFAEGRRPCVR